MKTATMTVDSERPTKILPRESLQAPKRSRFSKAHIIQLCSFLAIVVLFLIYKVDWNSKPMDSNSAPNKMPIRAIKPEIEKRWRGGVAVVAP